MIKYKPAHDLMDHELIQALRIIRPHMLRPWEQDLARGLPGYFLHNGRLSYGQRKAAREIINRIMLALAEIHNRYDLAQSPQRPTPVTPPPDPVEDIPDPFKLAQSLTPSQREALVVLSDREARPTSSTTHGGFVAGVTARALENRGLAKVSSTRGLTRTVKITTLGTSVASHIEPAEVRQADSVN